MLLRLLRTANDGGGTATVPAATPGGPAATTPAPAITVPASGPGISQPAGGIAPLDPGKKPDGGGTDPAGSAIQTPDRLKQLEQSRFLGILQNENADMRRKLAEYEAKIATPAAATTPAPTGPVPLATTPAAPTPFDERTYRAQLLKDPTVKDYLAELEEEGGGEREKERYLRGLIVQGRINHSNSQALLERTANIELENMAAAIDKEFDTRHPDFKTDMEHNEAFNKTLERLSPIMENPNSVEGQLALKEMIYELSMIQFLPKIIEARATAMAEEIVARERAKGLAGGTTAGGAASGTPGALSTGKKVPWEN